MRRPMNPRLQRWGTAWILASLALRLIGCNAESEPASLPDSGTDPAVDDATTDLAVDVANDAGPEDVADRPDTAADIAVDSGDDAAIEVDGGPDAGPDLDRACLDTPISADQLDPYGGWRGLELEATGFFRTAEVDGRWWLVTPDGHPYFSAGVNGVRSTGSAVGETGELPYRDNILERYGSVEVWAEVTLQRLRDWGFVTIGAWSEWERFREEVPYTVILTMTGSTWLEGDIPDYWDDAFEANVSAEAAPLAELANDPYLVGYFLDNEVRWGPDHRSTETLFDDYLAMPPEAPGKQRLVALLAERYEGDVDAFSAVWGVELDDFDDLFEVSTLPRGADREAAAADRAAFLADLAERFFAVATGAAHEIDPNHLDLGIRFVSVVTPPEVVVAAGRYVDVVSVNFYEYRPLVAEAALELSGGVDPAGWLSDFHELSGRPVLISEFGFRAADSGLPNSWPPIYPTFSSQSARADGLERYALASFAAPWIVGYHWFIYADQPALGRFDGEDNNWGLVDIEDEPYAPVVERAAWLHAAMYPCLAAWSD